MRYLVFNHRHMQWHRPDFQGYTDHVTEAGRFTAEQAMRQTLNGLPGANTPVDEQLAMNNVNMNPSDIEDLIDNTWRRI